MSMNWGWKDCEDGHCGCCTDCNNPACTRCLPWLTGLCQQFPADYNVDYIRVYQRRGNRRTGCSPRDFPTEGWIESQEQRYRLPTQAEPLRPVFAGGARCTDAADCGGSSRGSCLESICQCRRWWTGPACFVPRVGSALTCSPLEEAMIGGGTCHSESATDCGAVHGHSACVGVRTTSSWMPSQERKLPDSTWRKAGGGDGRCRCAEGREGPHCMKVVPPGSCRPDFFADPAMNGEVLDNQTERLCAKANSSSERDACNDVHWKPHWEHGGAYAQCGAFSRAHWVASAECRARSQTPRPTPTPTPPHSSALTAAPAPGDTPAPTPAPAPTHAPATHVPAPARAAPPAPMAVPAPAPTPAPVPSAGAAACAAHPGCSGFAEDCCPATDGMRFACCNATFHASADTGNPFAATSQRQRGLDR